MVKSKPLTPSISSNRLRPRKMKKIRRILTANRKSLNIYFLILAIPAVLVSSNLALAQERGVGLGVILGEPTGLSFKGWITKTSALDAGLAWSFGRYDALHVHWDYLFHAFNVFPVQEGKLPMYFGIGGRFKFGDESDTHSHHDENRVGIRIPLGLDYLFEKVPVDIFLELVPILDLAPASEFNFNAGLGARFFFEPGKPIKIK